MGERKPFTKRERNRWVQSRVGYRPVNGWGDGDLPAPWAEGDIVRLAREPDDETRGRLRGQSGPNFVVTYATSIAEGDAWYFRVRDGSLDHGSDRMHAWWGSRCTDDDNFPADNVDYMAAFDLVETADPHGLALRELLIEQGWQHRSRLSSTTTEVERLRGENEAWHAKCDEAGLPHDPDTLVRHWLNNGKLMGGMGVGIVKLALAAVERGDAEKAIELLTGALAALSPSTNDTEARDGE